MCRKKRLSIHPKPAPKSTISTMIGAPILWPTDLEIPLSSSWRVTQSNNQVMELANVLRGLQKLVGNFPGSTKQVVYSQQKGLSYNAQGNSPHISIDPFYAMKGGLPLDPQAMDILCGLTIHELAHSRTDVWEVIKDLSQANQDLGRGLITVLSISVIGEEIYSDNWVRRNQPRLFKYLRKARIAYAIPRALVNWNDILKAWLAISLYNHLPNNNASIEVLSALRVLLVLADTLRTADCPPATRRSLYRVAFADLQKLLQQPQTPPGFGPSPHPPLESGQGTHYDSDDLAEVGESRPPQPSDSPTDSPLQPGSLPHAISDVPYPSIPMPMHQATPLPEELHRQVNDAIEQDQEDLTSQIMKELEDTPLMNLIPVLGPIIRSNSQQKEILEPDFSLLPELQYLQRLKNTIGRQVLRSEPNGKLDQRNLHRAYTDGLAYKQLVQKPRQGKLVVLLLDGSGSMVGHKDIIYPAASSVLRVLMDKARVYVYRGHPDEVIIESHNLGVGRCSNIIPSGNTPSGLALLATALLHPKALIIHFTDGESNHGPSPEGVFPILEKSYPELHVVEINYRKGSDRGRDYQNLTRISGTCIDDISLFPMVLRKILEPWFMVS